MHHSITHCPPKCCLLSSCREAAILSEKQNTDLQRRNKTQIKQYRNYTVQTVALSGQFKVYRTEGKWNSDPALGALSCHSWKKHWKSIYPITNTCDNEKLIKDIVRKKNSLVFQQTALLTEITISHTTFLCVSRYRCASSFQSYTLQAKKITKNIFKIILNQNQQFILVI